MCPILLTMLIVLQIVFGNIFSVSTEAGEHTYVIFEDDFEDGEAGDWEIRIDPYAPPESVWAVMRDDTNYVLSMGEGIWAGAGHFTWTDYTLEAKIKLITWGVHVNFRSKEPEGRYFLTLHAGRLSLDEELAGLGFSSLKGAEDVFYLNKWYSFKIVCVGNSIQVYVDDVLKIDYVDEENPILSGRITFEGLQFSQFYIDEVKVTTSYRLYVADLIEDAQDMIDRSQMLGAVTSEAEGKLDEARSAFDSGNFSSAEAKAEEAFNLARLANVGHTSVDDLMQYPSKYDQRTVEVAGTIRNIRFEEGAYRFVVDDGTGVISTTLEGALGEIKSEDSVKVVGIFDASTRSVIAESAEKTEAEKPEQPPQELYSRLLFMDDFEDGDFSDWITKTMMEGSAWKLEKDGDNYVLIGMGLCWSEAWSSQGGDYVIELKIKLVEGSALINFHMKAGEEMERYAFLLNRYNLALLKEGLMEHQLTELRRVIVDLNPNVWYTVKIVCQKNNIIGYLNDAKKFDFTDDDDPILYGILGLETFDDESSFVYFDDVRVSEIAAIGDIHTLIAYAQSVIDEARVVNADVGEAEAKLDQAREALDQKKYQVVQYLVDEAVQLAKSASIGEISIKELKVMVYRVGDKISGHTVEIEGVVKDLEVRHGVGYDFVLNDGTDGIWVTYQGASINFGNGDEVRVSGIFNAISETVTVSKVEKISGSTTSPRPTQPQSGAEGITLSIQIMTGFITIGGAFVGVAVWLIRTRSTRRRRKILLKKLMDQIDGVYSSFKMNARRCEAELHRLREEVLDEFKQGMINEESYNTLDKRIEDYLKEVKEQIESEKL